jgi:aldehyde:ferredoxin oxidoreductase
MLRVDLDTGTTKIESTPTELIHEWLGGRGFVSKILYDEVPSDADPFGPENRLVIAPGPFTGLFIPAGSKCEFGAISPASNGVGDSNMGGHFGPELRYAGYDGVVIRGVSPEPVILVIDDRKVELRPAGDHWGKGSLETEAALKRELGEPFQIATVGPAGENGVAFSCITHFFGRQAGRAGVGAVMGKKGLKAVAVHGTGSVPVHDPKGLYTHTSTIIERTKSNPLYDPWVKYGTGMFVGWSNEQGTFPTRNFQTSHFEEWEKLDGEFLHAHNVVRDKACMGCWMRCGKHCRIRRDGAPDDHVEGPEYETTALMGGNCGISDINTVAHLNRLSDDLGMDTISAGSTAAFAIECFEKGILTKKDLDGRELGWGDAEGVEFVLRKIAAREGVGELLAQGTRKAAQKLGRDSIKFAVQTKGLEWSGYESRWAPSQMLCFMTADIGAHHNRGWAITVDVATGREEVKGKADPVIYLQHIRPLFDTWCICRLQWGELDVMPDEYAESFHLVTGRKVPMDEMLRISEKIWNLNRVQFLLRNGGPGRKHDTAPARFHEEPVPSGPAKGKHIPLDRAQIMLDEYYAGRGWDGDGNPTRELLEDLGIGDAADVLEKAGWLGKPLKGGIPAVRGREYKPAAM